MSDLISRQDAINCCSCLHPEECWDEIRKLPSAVEVVQCKDCKHWYSDADTGMACEFTNMSQPEDGYCNWGERREP